MTKTPCIFSDVENIFTQEIPPTIIRESQRLLNKRTDPVLNN